MPRSISQRASFDNDGDLDVLGNEGLFVNEGGYFHLLGSSGSYQTQYYFPQCQLGCSFVE